MTLRLNGSTSGYVEIDAPATAGSNTLVLPTGNGTNGQYLQTNGSGSLSWATVAANVKMGTGTAQSLTGTAVGFTGLPSTTFYIQVLLNEYRFSTTTYDPVFQIGDSGGYETTGYECRALYTGGGGTGSTANDVTGGFPPGGAGTGFTDRMHGFGHLAKLTGNTWEFHFEGIYADSAYFTMGMGVKTLSDTLDRIQFTSITGNTFNLGTFNIIYYYTV